ncbi:murein hydrolase activator EnvC family protein [Roseovarius aestuarii]|uniref:Peptidase family M23 n=1 Tax=Roseovarius aestuarii TaxID=475083 RepID=A0A1X7BKZ0_9RHOB|nr:peptidoglycan DD-metalloendopeptidase family protein [Roseovarius aestuarii]SMC10214.1 Peptidase family M23 [Roseovarius aestuarii]
MRLALALAATCLAGAALSQDNIAADNARAAADRLAEAAIQLDEAQGARDRVKALSETVHAFESGLEAMRDGLRQAAIREEVLSRELAAREDEIAQLLGVLQSMNSAPSPVLLLHPSGPVGTARSGMILAEVTPALNARANEIRSKLQEVSVLRALQQSAANKLQDGLNGVQEARIALSQAISDRTDLPQRFTEDPVKTALLIASTETLEGFASGLSQIATNETPANLPDIIDRKGALSLPVNGRILRRANEADAAGIARPGIVMATRPRALVSTPAAATLRYSGPLLDYGNVIILEPQSGILMVFAGLDVVYGRTGQVLSAGSPLGLMGGADPDPGALLPRDGQETTTSQTETLYIEVRKDNIPVDPAQWFKTDEG